MSNSFQLQSSRYEFKYLVSEQTAKEIRKYISSYVIPDPYTKKAPDSLGYTICSLYLDSPTLNLYGQTCVGAKNRFKLRIRFYDNDDSSPAFLEIKRRENSVIKKNRVSVTKEGASQILLGKKISPSFFFNSNHSYESAEAIHEFCELRDKIEAQGCTYVLYSREAYGSEGTNKVRITFDRNLEGGEYKPQSHLQFPHKTKTHQLNGVVLELKFTDRFPNWMQDLVQTFGLERTSVAKYCKCVEELQIKALPQAQ